MATHILVNPDVITSTTFEKAFLDVSGEPLNADVKFTVYGIGRAVGEDRDRADERAELRHVTGAVRHVGEEDRADHRPDDRPVDAVHGHASPAAGADQGGADDPVVEHHAGAFVQLPLGDLSGGANLYIGNPNPSDAIVDLQYGNSTAPVVSPLTVGPTSAAKIPLPPTPINTNLIVNVRSDFPVVVQAVNRGAVPGRVPDRSGGVTTEPCSLCGGAHPDGECLGISRSFDSFAMAAADGGRARRAGAAGGRAGRRISGHRVAGPGWDGRRVLRRPPAAGTAGRDQGPEPAGRPCRGRGALSPGGARRQPAAPPEHRRRVRVRADAGRPLLPGDGVPGRREPARDPGPATDR